MPLTVSSSARSRSGSLVAAAPPGEQLDLQLVERGEVAVADGERALRAAGWRRAGSASPVRRSTSIDA